MNRTSTAIAVIIVVLILIGGIYYAQNNKMSDDALIPGSTDSTGVVAGNSSNGTAGTVANTPQPVVNRPASKDPSKPEVVTGQKAFPSDTGVTITGGVIPNGAPTTYWFEYGTSPSAGSKTNIQTIGGGYVLIPAPANIAGLKSNTKYYYQLVAENQFGKVSGEQYTFQTTLGTPARNGSVPTVTTRSANGITDSEANLTGTIDPNSDATSYWFEYGKTRDLGDATVPVSVGAGTVAKPVSSTVIGLDNNTTYYYRINAQNDFGTANGKVMTFKTTR